MGRSVSAKSSQVSPGPQSSVPSVARVQFDPTQRRRALPASDGNTILQRSPGPQSKSVSHWGGQSTPLGVTTHSVPHSASQSVRNAEEPAPPLESTACFFATLRRYEEEEAKRKDLPLFTLVDWAASITRVSCLGTGFDPCKSSSGRFKSTITTATRPSALMIILRHFVPFCINSWIPTSQKA